ncbi:MAG: asparagine synthase (glutamine-hydrolyzing) [Microscillaceae bacterium]
MGHRRLSVLDLSERSNQPMYSLNGRYVMVYNGEVYNYEELARQLTFTRRTSSDSEVILELFAKEHYRFVYRLNGMFALAIYDRQEHTLYLFRDRIGIKPIFYYWDEHHFAFASELKALLTLPQLAKKLNRKAVADFLQRGYIPAPATIYENIYKMPAGSWLRISKEGLHQEKYWDLGEKIYASETQARLNNLNQEPEAKKQLHKLLQSAVAYRLISDVPVGVFLSGGIDSSLVAALATSVAKQKTRTFSIRFAEAAFNEADYARKVAEKLATHHEEFTVTAQEAQALIPQLVHFYDEPFADSSAIPTYLVSKLARQKVTVALGGDGGDELFFGYGTYQWAQRLRRGFWKNMRHPLAQTFGLMKSPRYQKARRLLAYPSPHDLPAHIFSQEQQFFSRPELNELLLRPEFGPPYQTPVLKRVLNPMEQQAFFDLQFYLPDDLLTKVDRASMQHALELRVPLLDHRVIEFALNLHPGLKYRKGESKYLLKQILFDYLPKNLFERPKQGFAIPLAKWLQKDLAYLLDDYLSPTSLQRYGLVKPEWVADLLKKFHKGQVYYYHRLWLLVVLHQFLRESFPQGID